MAQESTGTAAAALASLATGVASLNGSAMMGACFGCFCYLALSSLTPRKQRIFLLIFSWGLGYAAGEFWGDEGRSPMLYALAFSALGAVVFTAFYRFIDKDAPMPPWLDTLIKAIPSLRDKG